ncbi:uncharacterized protein LOC119114067 [Pollicipes pollicipes]|uniref:uncharacterized protein LOC119114067 n=1 Tax=Pollicipes pollicipes TaxID=41117 RepID=UPI0018852EA7|nr:uncharacterized protein LOC119114067 [Pollicipes pollicipes]
MAVANDPYIGAWKVVEVISLCGSGGQTSLEGTEMKLDEAGDVTWILPEGGDVDCALFRCEAYDLVTDHSYNNDRRSLMLAAVSGHAIVFKVDHPTPQDLMVLTCEDWCILQCQRVPCREPPPDHAFSLARLLGAEMYADLTLTAADGTQLRAHSLVVRLLAPTLDWPSDPLRHLPAEQLRALLHYLYTESLPALAELCRRYVTNVSLREALCALVWETLGCCQSVADQLAAACRDQQQGVETVFGCPGRVSALVRLCLRQVAVGLSKLTLAFDLYGRHEASLDAAERREVIRYAQSRLPLFLGQLQRVLLGLRSLLSAANQAQRTALAARAVSELEWL